MNRRQLLALAGSTVSLSFAGCVADDDADEPSNAGDGPEGDDHNDDDNGDDRDDDDSDGDDGESDDPGETDDPGENDDPGEIDPLSIDGRLFNDNTDARKFGVRIQDESGETILDEERTVEGNSHLRVPALARPGDTQTIAVTVDDTQESATLTYDVEPTPGKLDGYVDIHYGVEGISISFTPRDDFADDPDIVLEEPRIDEPPHDIDVPPTDDWDADYLGRGMAVEPSLSFTHHDVTHGILTTKWEPSYEDEFYRVALVESAAQRQAVLDLDVTDEATRQALESVDFDASLIVVVESGYGSGSIDQRWARVEDVADGIHLHGYHTDPRAGTDDVTTWVSCLVVTRPAGDVDLARVSLTVDPDRRVHFNSTEGPVPVSD